MARIAALLGKPYARFFGFELVAAEAGAVTLALSHRRDFEHAPGFQGALTSAMGELAAAYAAIMIAPPGRSSVTLSQSILFAGAARGERMVGEGRVIASGRTVCQAAADVFVEGAGERRLCAQLAMTLRYVASGADTRP